MAKMPILNLREESVAHLHTSIVNHIVCNTKQKWICQKPKVKVGCIRSGDWNSHTKCDTNFTLFWKEKKIGFFGDFPIDVQTD